MPTVNELRRLVGETTVDVEARVLGFAVISAQAHAERDENYEVELRVGPVVYRVIAKQFPVSALVMLLPPRPETLP